ncbi:hypothetical protein Cantr_01891 [Candida viswanathii]|uniref:Uncharacterized protein n=1 Tax=Candida viswanathii TaxID=5486 RepID=A0A367YKF4_9ASCO|nr:hypothetical protein Cantr_01891 [Candida viswanathii]
MLQLCDEFKKKPLPITTLKYNGVGLLFQKRCLPFLANLKTLIVPPPEETLPLPEILVAEGAFGTSKFPQLTSLTFE